MRRLFAFFLRFRLAKAVAKKMFNAGWLDFVVSHDPRVRRIFDLGAQFTSKTTRRLCVFANFSPNSVIHEYVLFYLDALHKEGFDIIFVSTSPSLPQVEIEKLRPFVHKAVVRDNVGYDFASYKTGLYHAGIDLGDYDELLLTNDSCYGPLFPLGNVFKKMRKENYALWGIADNYEHSYHLMSYFLVFSKSSFMSPQFNSFWAAVITFPPQSKERIIQQYEIGLSRLFILAGNKVGAYCAFEDVVNLPSLSDKRESELFLSHRATSYCASVHYFWREIIVHKEFPFIKADVVRKNPTRSRVLDWSNIVEKTDYPVRLIWDSIKIDR